MAVNKYRHVLIIRYSSIGDIILTTPIIRVAKLQLNATVSVLTLSKNAMVLESNPYIDNILHCEDEIDLSLYDLIIDLQKNRRSSIIRWKAKCKTLTFNKLNIKKWIFTTFRWNTLPQKHLVDRYFEAVNKVGLSDDGCGLDFYYSKGEIDRFDLPVEYIVINCGGTYITKRIPIDICRKIIEKSSYPVILLGGKDVSKLGAQFGAAMKVVNLIGITSLQESAEIIDNCMHLYTSDSALMHIGAALNKDITVLWGNTSREFGMYPYLPKDNPSNITHKEVSLGCRPCSKLGYGHCPKGHFRCMLDQDI